MQEKAYRPIHERHIRFVISASLSRIRPLSRIVFLEMSTGNRKARVPWAELQRARGEYISSKYLPMQVSLRQYYHLRQGDVDSILRHWVRRQAAGMVPFCFKKVTKATPQGSGNGAGMESSGEDEGLQSGDSGSDHSGEEDNLGQTLGNTAGNSNEVGSLLKRDGPVLMSLKF